MRAIALTRPGHGQPQEIEVTEISVWHNRCNRHPVTPESITALLKEAKKTNRMQIQTRQPHKGCINALDGTPLFTNGEEWVEHLAIDGEVVWMRLNETQEEE